MCDDLHATVEHLKRKGIRFSEDMTDAGWGLLTTLTLPGGDRIALYEPRHPRPTAA